MPETRFLLAYHYMSCGHPEAAAAQFREASALNSKDQLSVQMLAALSGDKSSAAPTPVQTTGPSLPLSTASLTGDWMASRADGSTFVFHLGSDASYSWQFTQQGRTQQYNGTYIIADSLLILKHEGNPTLIGQVSMPDPNHFNFRLLGANVSDPGLTFSKR